MTASIELTVLGFCALAFALSGCRRDMADQPRFKPLAANDLFADGAASRLFPDHTIARGELHEDGHFFAGKVGDAPATEFPEPVSRAMIERGRERYDIYCAVCHGLSGAGNGIIVQRGFPPPPSLHLARLRDAPVGHYFEVITNGFGLMYPYSARVAPADRWAIIAYIRALQFSQNAAPADAEPAQLSKLEALPR